MKTKFPKKSLIIKPIVYQLKDLICQRYGDRLKHIILYGSYARGDFKPESDIDLLIVLDNIKSVRSEIDELTKLKIDLMIENEIYISTNPTTVSKFDHSGLVFFKNIRSQGIEI